VSRRTINRSIIQTYRQQTINARRKLLMSIESKLDEKIDNYFLFRLHGTLDILTIKRFVERQMNRTLYPLDKFVDFSF